jgi:transcriptional regulator with GAF, ATPase, and Fis domain
VQTEHVRRVVDAFVTLVDTLVTDDVDEVLQMLADDCRDLFDVLAAGVLLADHNGGLQLAVASTPDQPTLELFEMQQQVGPGFEAFKSGAQVLVEDLKESCERWPQIARRAGQMGYRGAFAFPLRSRDQAIGALNLFRAETGSLSVTDIDAAQGLADVTAIIILHGRRVVAAEQLVGQLQTALDSRVVIEQAKGIIAESLDLDVDTAFGLIRRYARDNNRRLREVAGALVDGELAAAQLIGHQASGGSGRPGRPPR